MNNNEIENTENIENHMDCMDFTNSFIGELLNNYILYYKKINNLREDYTLFYNMDTEDPLSINKAMEEIYNEMSIYNENLKNNSIVCDIIPYDDISDQVVNCEELYCILIDGNPKCVCQSLFSILIEFTSITKNPSKSYEIINLK
jgi:hypothetical protein